MLDIGFLFLNLADQIVTVVANDVAIISNESLIVSNGDKSSKIGGGTFAFVSGRRRFCFLAVVVAVGVANNLRAEREEDDDEEDALLLLAFLEFREQRELLEDALPPAAEKEDGEEMARHDKLDDIFSFFSSVCEVFPKTEREEGSARV